MSSTDHLSELDLLRSQVADLSRELAERDRSAQDLREQSNLLRTIVNGTATETGEEFFTTLVTQLTSRLHIQYAVIGEVQGDHTKKIRTLAVSAGDTIVDNFEYELTHTPCATALAQTVACFDRDLQVMFPQFQRLVDLGAESYCAVSIRGKDGAVVGLLVVMDTKPLEHSDEVQSLLAVFAPRIAAEFERKRAVQERTQALADLHNVIEAIPDIVFVLDTLGNLVKWNRRVVDVTGYSPEDLLNMPALAFVPPEDQASTAAAIQRAFTEGYAELEGRLLTKDHRLIPYHWTGALLKNSHGEPIGITGIGRDASDKKQAEVALRESEERLALAVEGSSDVLWDAHRLLGEPWYAPQTPIWWSPRIRELLGLEESDLFETFEQWVDRLHRADKDRVFGQLAAHIEQRIPYDVEYRLRTNAGDYRWIRGRGQAQWDNQGEPSRMSGSCQDITERKRIEQALHASEERFNLAVRGSSTGIWDWDLETNNIYFSPLWKSMLGYEEHELRGEFVEWEKRLHPDDRERALATVRLYLEGTTPQYELEHRLRHKDGSYRWILARGVSLSSAEGAPYRMAGSHVDITDRKQAEEALRKSEGHFRAIFQNTAVGIAFGSHTTGTGISEANPAFQSMTGYSLEELCRLGMKGLTYPGDLPASKAFMEQLVSGTQTHGTIEKRYLKRDGPIMWALTTVSSILDEQGNYENSVAMIQDITERKINEQLLAAQKRVLEMMVTDASLQEILTIICRVVEELLPRAHCSILLLDRDGLHLRHGAAPSLSEAYVHAIDGVAIGPAVGSCGTAAFTRCQVIVSNIAEDPLWTDYRDLALGHGLQACWSTPVISSDGTVLGTFALYYVEPQQPTDADLRLVEQVVHFACIAIERKQTEEALRKSEERWQLAVRGSNDGIWDWMIQTDEVFFSPRWKEMRGFEDHEIANDVGEWQSRIHPDDLNRVLQVVDGYLARQVPEFSEEYRLRRKDGSYMWVLDRGIAIWADDGTPLRMVGSETDITERKRAYSLLLAVINSTADGLLAVDRKGKVIIANNRFFELWRIPKNFLDRGDDAALLDFVLDQLQEPEAFVRRAQELYEHPEQESLDMLTFNDGRVLERYSRAQILEEEEGKKEIVGRVWSFRDVTERYRAEESLREMNVALANAMPGISRVGPDGRYLAVNEAYVGALGYDPSELIGEEASRTVHPDDRPRMEAAYATMVREGKGECEVLAIRKDGSTFWKQILMVKILDKEGRHLGHHCFMRDITKRKQFEAMRVRQYEALQAIFNITIALSRASSLEEVYEQGIDGVQRALKVDRASILLFDHDGVMRFKASRGLSKGYVQAVEGHSPWSREAVDPPPICVADIEEDPSMEAYRGIFHAERIRALGFIPLWSSDGLLGKFMLYYDSPHQFTEEEIQVAQTIAAHIAFMIQRKRAETSLARRERELRTVLESLPVGVWFTDAQGKMLLSNPAAQEIWTGVRQISMPNAEENERWWEETGPLAEPHRWALTSALLKGEASMNNILEIDCLDGSRKVVRNSVVPVHGAEGALLGAILVNEDITLLRQAQEALRLTQFSVDHAVEGFFWISPDARILNVNEAACRMLEYSREELTAMTVHDIDPNFSPEAWPTHWAELKRKGWLTFETKYWSRTGRVLDMEVTVNYLQHEGTEYNCAIMRDIGERKRAQAALCLSEERYRSLYDETPTMYFTLAVDGTVRSVNRFGAEQLGYQVEELTGHSVLGLFHEEDKEVVAASLSECLATPEIPRHWEFRKIRKDGAVIWVRETVHVGQASSGEAIVLVTCEDITERKQVEQELRKSHTFLRQIIDTDPNFIFAKDREGRFTLVNKAVADVYGTTVDDLIGKTDADFNPNQEEVAFFRQKDLAVMDTLHELFLPEEVITDSGGRTRWLQTVKRPILDDEGRATMVLGASTDITERKRMEAVLRQRERDLCAAIEERERISQDLHDGILQSLFAVGLALETAKSMMPASVRKQSGQPLDQGIQQLNLIMREIRNFIAGLGSDLLQGKDLTMALKQMLASLTESQAICVRLAVEDRAAKALSTEQSLHLIRVIQEAVSNCIQHGHASEARVSLKLLKQGVRLSVRDNGCGFKQTGAKRTGHGLRNMASRAKKIGGKFSIFSKVNEGTRIVFDVPRETADVSR